jgi:protein-tyrosine phosphatase
MDVTHLAERLWIGAFDASLLSRFDVVVMCAPLRNEERAPCAKLRYFPFADDIQEPSLTELQTIGAASTLVASLFRSGEVVVACREGKNRSGLVAALALRRAYGWTGEQARDFVRKRRPGAIYNWHFEQLLLGPLSVTTGTAG